MLNSCNFMGRLTAEPELKTTPKGVSVTSFCIAVDRNYTDGSGERKTDFFTVVAWRGTAGFVCKYFGKGDLIALHGSLQTRVWLDKHNNKRTVQEIVPDSVYFCGSKRNSSAAPAGGADDIPLPDEPPEDVATVTLDDSDLPF